MFENMISKSLIQILWVLLSIGVVIAGLANFLTANYKTFGLFFWSMFYIVVGLIIVRVICEQIIVIFMMHENLERSRFAIEQLRSDQNAMQRTMSSLIAQPQSATPVSAPIAPRKSNPSTSASISSSTISGRPPASGWHQAYAEASIDSPETTDEPKI